MCNMNKLKGALEQTWLDEVLITAYSYDHTGGLTLRIRVASVGSMSVTSSRKQEPNLFRQRRAKKDEHDAQCSNSSHSSAGGLGVGVPLLQQGDLSQGQGHQGRPRQQPCAGGVPQDQLQDIKQEQAPPCQSCDRQEEVQRRGKT